LLRAFAARTADEPGHAATGAGNQPAANRDTARADAGFSDATGYNAAWCYAASYYASSGTEHAACGTGKPESAAAVCAVRDNGKSVASAAESGDYIS
jgi:hypothetical protein